MMNTSASREKTIRKLHKKVFLMMKKSKRGASCSQIYSLFVSCTKHPLERHRTFCTKTITQQYLALLNSIQQFPCARPISDTQYDGLSYPEKVLQGIRLFVDSSYVFNCTFSTVMQKTSFFSLQMGRPQSNKDTCNIYREKNKDALRTKE